MKSRVMTFMNQHYGNQHAAKVLYGTILLFVTLVGLDASGISTGYWAALNAFIAVLAIIVAEDYAELIGFTIKNKRALNKQERREIFDDTVAVATFCLVPIVILLVSETSLYSVATAFNYTFLYCVSVLFVFSYWAARLSGYQKLRSLITATITASIGLAIIYIKSNFGK
ncbi:hypothetical protein IPL68_06130 [Candidatus Saccharibacteria bacterium]|nr:MAG: hypothetical protein IPL68_06130 [Candidatus Saccharibacteria bacterium]